MNVGSQADTSAVETVASAGVGWVRLNFIVYEQQTGTGDPDFIEMYGKLIDAYLARGIRLYGLIGEQSVKAGLDSKNQSAFVQPFVASAIEIIQRWGTKIQFFELVNEPNNWTSEGKPRLSSSNFALILQKVYEAKMSNGWKGVNLVSGPLLSHDGDTAAQYLLDTYKAGMEEHAWDWCFQQWGTYPLDGVGYHLYVAQWLTEPATVDSTIRTWLGTFWREGIAAGEQFHLGAENEAGAMKKQVFISEFGWESSADGVGEQGQASNIVAALDVFNTYSDSVGQPSLWGSMVFTLYDFDGLTWGMQRAPGQPKPAWEAFLSWNRLH